MPSADPAAAAASGAGELRGEVPVLSGAFGAQQDCFDPDFTGHTFTMACGRVNSRPQNVHSLPQARRPGSGSGVVRSQCLSVPAQNGDQFFVGQVLN